MSEANPVASIMADAATVPAVVERVSWWRRLLQPSPRSMEQLREDLLAQLINEGLELRVGSGTASGAQLGESIMDCTYALMGGEGGSAESPLGRLWRSITVFLGKLRNHAKESAGATP